MPRPRKNIAAVPHLPPRTSPSITSSISTPRKEDFELIRTPNTLSFSLRRKPRPVPQFAHSLSLGSLACLPFELRQQILGYVFDDCRKRGKKPVGQWNSRAGGETYMLFSSVFQEAWTSKLISSTGWGPRISSIRLTSKVLRAEGEDLLLITHTFTFTCHHQLTLFLSQLEPHQRPRLFSIAFVLFTCTPCCWTAGKATLPKEEWMDALAGLKGTGVQRVKYELGLVGGRSIDEAVEGIRKSKGRMERGLQGLDVLNQRVLRVLGPGVRTGMTGTLWRERLDEGERGAFERVLREGTV